MHQDTYQTVLLSNYDIGKVFATKSHDWMGLVPTTGVKTIALRTELPSLMITDQQHSQQIEAWSLTGVEDYKSISKSKLLALLLFRDCQYMDF